MKEHVTRQAPSPDEQEYIRKHIREHTFDSYLLIGAGIFITGFLWFVVNATGFMRYFMLLPGVIAIIAALWLARYRNSALHDALQNGITVVSNTKIEAKDHGETYGYRLKIRGTLFTVNKQVWKALVKNDVITIRAIPQANVIFELKKGEDVLMIFPSVCRSS